MVDHKDEAVNIAEEHMVIPRSYLERALADQVCGAVALDLHLNRAGLAATISLMQRDHTGSFTIAADAVPEKYVAGSYLKDAQRAQDIPENIPS
jgi:hypothetical protein